LNNVGQEAITKMLCSDFEDQLTDYIEGVVSPETNRLMAEHSLRCPVCHELLSAVRSTVQACKVAPVPTPSRELEARILLRTIPESSMSCEDFEEFLTDYLDGFLPAHLYHRWERHAALCDRCTELPGEVVRAIGACYTYIAEEQPVPAGLNERILQATLGTVVPEEVRAPWTSRAASWLRSWLDPIMSPQLATVATMLLVAILVLTNTVSADGSISGVYNASLLLAEQTSGKAKAEGKEVLDDSKHLIVPEQQKPVPPPPAKESTEQSKEQDKSESKANNGSNNR
jgi:anti-sigma factor RsiW